MSDIGVGQGATYIQGGVRMVDRLDRGKAHGSGRGYDISKSRAGERTCQRT
jgi:hypothetical protein